MPATRGARPKVLIDRQWYCAPLATPVHPALLSKAGQEASTPGDKGVSPQLQRVPAGVQQHSLSMTAMAQGRRTGNPRRAVQRLQLSQDGLQQAWAALRDSLVNRSPLLYKAMGSGTIAFVPPAGAQVIFSSNDALNQCRGFAPTVAGHMQKVFAVPDFALDFQLSEQGQREAEAEKAKRLVGTRDDSEAFIKALRRDNGAADELFRDFGLEF